MALPSSWGHFGRTHTLTHTIHKSLADHVFLSKWGKTLLTEHLFIYQTQKECLTKVICVLFIWWNSVIIEDISSGN